ncbi:hypothetical protein KC921_02865 [Candidatus Woesebacteria bacterium]|nr:hypothetical protein [Candidatus Woesebacteria bacterium]
MSERLTTQPFSDREAASWWNALELSLRLRATDEPLEMPENIKLYKVLIHDSALDGSSAAYESINAATSFAVENKWLNSAEGNDVVVVEVTVIAPGVVDNEKIIQVLAGSEEPFSTWINTRNERRLAVKNTLVSE